MPSIRKRLKKLTSSKKSKSTNDLDQMRPNDGFPHENQGQDDDTCSQISEAVSERTDISAMTNDSSYGHNASGEEKKKKKRRLRLTFPRRKKKEKPGAADTGTVLFRSMSVEHDPRGIGGQRSLSESAQSDEALKPETQNLSRSVGDILEVEENPGVDTWRMSGLLESVDRTSSTSSTHDISSGKDNLISTFEDRRKKILIVEPAHASTPLKDLADKADGFEKFEEATEENSNGKLTGFMKPAVNIEVSFTDSDRPNRGKDEPRIETNGALAEPLAQKDHVDEDILEETRNVDPESQIEFKDDDEPISKSDEIYEQSFVCDIGRGKKVVIRHMREVVNNGDFELSEKVVPDDWLVLNMIKDDWVVVGYSKVGGEIKNIFDQSVEAVY